MAEQMTMTDILGDNDPLPKNKEPAKEVAKEPATKEALYIPKLGDKPLPEEPKIERSQSKRKQWEEKEQAAKGRVRNPETGQYVQKEDAAPDAPKGEPAKATEAPAKPAVAAPPQDFTDKEKAFQRAMLEERGKRQELERRIAAMEAAKAQTAAPAGTTEIPQTFWDDPEGALAKHQAKVSEISTNARLATAEFIARQKHTDFDEKIEQFGKILQQTPGLHQQWLAAPDPAEFAYVIGKNHLELQQAGSIDNLRAKIEQETRLKMEDELRVKADTLAKERAALPPSLSEARSVGTNKPVWGGPPSMDEILSGE